MASDTNCLRKITPLLHYFLLQQLKKLMWQDGLVKIIWIIFISKYKTVYIEYHVLSSTVWIKVPVEDCQSSNSAARKITWCPSSWKDKANFIVVFKILLKLVHTTNFTSVRKSDVERVFWMSTALQWRKRRRNEKQGRMAEIKLCWCHQVTNWNLKY